MTALVLVMLYSIGKGFAYISPLFILFGESAKAYEDERYQYIKVIDLGCEPY